VKLRRARLPRVLADASLRVRVMAAAAILVALTSLVTGFLGTALLRSYLYSRADAQLSHFAAVASRVLQRSSGPGGRFAHAASSIAHTVSVHLTAPVTLGAMALAVVLAVAGGLIAGSLGGWRAVRLRPAAALARVE